METTLIASAVSMRGARQHFTGRSKDFLERFFAQEL
jgi:hypothetical protein